jgi:hypothetical protein
MRSRLVLCVIGLALAVGIPPNLFAAVTHATVGFCAGPGIHYSKIQDAVNAVSSSGGAIIGVCPGNYPEQVTITSSLTLQGIASGQADAAVILPPTGGMQVSTSDLDTGGHSQSVAAQIFVHNTAGVTISNLTVDGTGNQYATDDLRGILYQDASGTVNHVAVRNEIPGDTLSGIQSGQGIFVETDTGSAALLVENSSVHNYQKNGIVARYNAFLTATGNYVQGVGPTDQIAQNGIELFKAGGTIKGNTVIDNFDTLHPVSTNILLYDTTENSGNSVTTNTTGNSNIGIQLVNDAPSLGDFVSVTANKITGTNSDAIDVCTSANTIKSNLIFNSAQSAIHLDNSCEGSGINNFVNANTMQESACAGILMDSAQGNNTGPPNNLFWDIPQKITSSTSSCTAPSALARKKTTHKVSP